MWMKRLVIFQIFFTSVLCATAPFDVSLVKSIMTKNAKSSWEFGTVAEALLELDNVDTSVFGATPFATVSSSIEGLAYAKSHITLGGIDLISSSSTNSDPASLGVFAVMLGKSDSSYTTAARTQLNTLLYNTPRASNGAISHRSKSVAMWSDFMYMVPPFMAYYAASTNNQTLLDLTMKQCAEYRALLKSSSGAWAHISASSHPDAGLWSSGNGWAAMGLTRVLATVLKSSFASSIQQTDASNLIAWIKEIIDGAKATPRSSGLLYNYLGNTASLPETSGTSLLAAVVYRMAVLEPSTFDSTYIAWAKTSLDAIAAHVGSTGIVSPAVNPYGYTSTTPYTTGSPEGQAFAVMLYAAHRDCVSKGVCTS